MRILDRYILWNTFLPFLYCFLGFLAIWLVIDLSDNLGKFLDGQTPLADIVQFYIVQLPDIIVLCLPVGLLLSILYSLSRMSRSNEIISMLTAGVGLYRMILPLLLFGTAVALFSLALNYKLAPEAQALREPMLESFKTGEPPEEIVRAMIFKNRGENRTWFIERFNYANSEIRGAQIIQQNENKEVIEKIYARRAIFNPWAAEWSFQAAYQVKFAPDGRVLSNERLPGEFRITHWDETPWRIFSANLNPEILTVPELKEFLDKNQDFPPAILAPFHTHYHYRHALPWTCLIVVIIATPLAIVHSRRGVLAGVAVAVFIFFIMIFLTNLFLALGSGMRISAWMAAWGPNLLFLTIGLYFTWLRATNREKLNLISPVKRAGVHIDPVQPAATTT